MNNAKLYAQSNGLQKRDATLVLRQYIPRMNWSDDDTILDVGSGSGDVTRNILLPSCPTFGKIIGVDRSKDMVEYASQNFTHEFLRYHHLDMNTVTQPRQTFPEGFTKVFSFYCLHWIQDHTRVLNNVYQLLRPGGVCLLTFLAYNPIFDMYERISELTEWAPYMTDVKKYVPTLQKQTDPASVFQASLEKCGFKVIVCEAPDFTYVFENLSYLKNALKAVNPFIHRIPEKDHEAYLNACLQEFRKMKIPEINGKMVSCYRLLTAYAIKEN